MSVLAGFQDTFYTQAGPMRAIIVCPFGASVFDAATGTEDRGQAFPGRGWIGLNRDGRFRGNGLQCLVCDSGTHVA